MKKFGVLNIVIEPICSYADLERNAGQGAITVGAFSTRQDVQWRQFHRGDEETFFTGAYNDLTPTVTDADNDGLVIVTKVGIYIVDYYVRWISGTYAKRIQVNAGYGGGTNLDVEIDRRDPSGFGPAVEGVGSDNVYGDHAYQHYRRCFYVGASDLSGNGKAYIQFSLINESGSSRNVTAQFASIAYIPSPATPTTVFA